MPEDNDAPKSDRTTANAPVSDIGAGGTRPAPAPGKPASKPPVESGDQNTNPDHGTDRA